jgi:hypothetical protein
MTKMWARFFWLIRYLRSVEPEEFRVAGAKGQSSTVFSNGVFEADVTSNDELVKVRWRVTDWFFQMWGWLVVFFVVVAMGATAASTALQPSFIGLLGGAISCLWILASSRLPVLLYRPRRRTLLRALDLN